MSNANGGPNGAPTGTYAITTDCMRCGVCEFMCPERAIIEARRQAIILKRECTGCGECAPYCPVRAIVPLEQFLDRRSRSLAAGSKDVLWRPAWRDARAVLPQSAA